MKFYPDTASDNSPLFKQETIIVMCMIASIPCLKTSDPINKFSDLVKYIVHQLKVLCPTLGTKKLAHLLTKAGLKLSASSVKRFLKKRPDFSPSPEPEDGTVKNKIVSKHPNHIWLTDIPTAKGFSTAWLPFSLPQCWPFAYWAALVIDHFSRTCIGFSVFKKQPTSKDIQMVLNRAIRRVKKKPKHIITDKGSQFYCNSFKKWCKKRKVKSRFGAVGRYGSISVIERFIKSLKQECTRKILVPLSLNDFRKHINDYTMWYNCFRPMPMVPSKRPNRFAKSVSGRSDRLAVSDAREIFGGQSSDGCLLAETKKNQVLQNKRTRCRHAETSCLIPR